MKTTVRQRMVSACLALGMGMAVTPALAGNPLSNFDFHAYARGGLGVNAKGGYQQVFQLNGADRSLRLGNKNDLYMELAYVHTWLQPDENSDVELGTRLMLSYWGHNIGSDPFNGNPIHFREAYAWLGEVIHTMPSVRFWAGQRYYGREYIPMIDLFYSSAEGVGGGVEGIDLGFGKVALGYVGAAKDTIGTANGEFEEYARGKMVKSTLDLRLYEVKLPLGTGKTWFNLAHVPGGRIEEADRDVSKMWGLLGGAQWTVNIEALGGDNHLGAVYKQGLNNFREFPDGHFFNNQGGYGDYVNVDEYQFDSWRVLVADWFAFQIHSKLSLQGLVLMRILDNGVARGKHYWYSTGIQPTFHYAEHFALTFEAGFDYVDDRMQNRAGHLAKFTLAQKIMAAPFWWANPSVQFYLTYATWDRDVGLAWSWSNNGSGVHYQDRARQDSQGLAAGVMFEAFF